MASNYTCRACLRALRLRHLQSTQTHPTSSFKLTNFPQPSTSRRNFGITSRFLATPQPKPREDQTPATTDEQAPADPLAQGDLLKDAPSAIKLAQQLRSRSSKLTETYVAYGSTEALFKICAAQANYDIPQIKENQLVPKTASDVDLGVGDGWWYNELKLVPTFSTWAHVTFLHMYILTVRLRLLPADEASTWQQHLIDHFFFDAEMRMETLHGMVSRTVRSKYLKDLYVQWRGVLAAYDEGLVKSDTVLASAVWRNIFQGAENVDAVDLALVVSYLRREVANVGRMSHERIAQGRINFGDPGEEKPVVLMESHLMRKSEEGAAL